MKFFGSIFSLILLVAACTSINEEQPVSYTLEQLQDNMRNKQGLEVEPKIKIGELCESFKGQSLKEITKRLTKEDLGLYEASYGLHYMGNRYLQSGDFRHGIHFLEVAADEYFNPLSMLKLARIYYMSAEQIQASFPNGALDGFSQDWKKAYYYINMSLSLTEEITGGRRGHYLIDVVVFNGIGILDELSAHAQQGDFDEEAARKYVDEHMQPNLNLYKYMYGDDPIAE
ncbi:MAG: hypothetical protein GY810_07470 [Aureispira sp.]|nr:hypothetical protein [Aureispira sp.]